MSLRIAGAPFETGPAGIRVRVRLTPRSARDVIEGVEQLSDGGMVLKARVRAVPERGKANAALEELLAKALGRPKSSVSVVGGETSRLKVVEVLGDPERLANAIGRLPCG
jgi:uncharacterized protein YggU (UPF0235/DUF167 family)